MAAARDCQCPASNPDCQHPTCPRYPQPGHLAGATEPGPENAYPSTPGEFAARWNSLDEDQRAGWLRAMAAESERAVLCKLRHGPRQHGTIDQLVRDAEGPLVRTATRPMTVVELLRIVHPDWTDERIADEARDVIEGR